MANFYKKDEIPANLLEFFVPAEIGLEATPDEFIGKLVEVFREVKRVLRDDGTLWLNCGDSYSTGVPNIANLLQSDFEKGVFFFGSANPRGRTAERINVLIYDKRSPNLVFKPLFTAQRVSIKQGKHDLCEIGGALDAPIQHFISCTIGSACPDNANAELCMDVTEHIGIVVAAGDLHADASLRRAIALSIKNSKTTLSIEIAAEPIAEGVPSAVPAFDAVTFNTAAKSRAKVDAVNNAVSLLDGAELSASQCGNFAVREATSEKLSLRLHGGADVCFIGVGHLFLFEVGLSPYAIILDKAKRKWNAQRPKQELGIPEILKRALMEDGWICRQTIIWHKPNPMPESVQGSHYSRHRVTIEEYEKLSNLQYTDERLGDDWAGDMPSLSEREEVSRKAPLSAKPQGAGNSQSEGVTRGRARKAEGVQPVQTRLGQQGKIRKDGEGHQDAQGGHRSIQGNPESENDASPSPPENEIQPDPYCAAAGGGIQIHPKPERKIAVEAHVCAAQGRDTFNNKSIDGGGLGFDCGGQSGFVPLLRDADEADAGSRHSVEQGRPAHERECGSGLPAVQLQKEQQDTAVTLVGCPGCPKCIQHHGYIFHLSAGRCTKSHESIFLLAKSEKYYFDNGAIKEQAVSDHAPGNNSHKGAAAYATEEGEHHRTKSGLVAYAQKQRAGKAGKNAFRGQGHQRDGENGPANREGRDMQDVGAGETRNKRSVWTVATTPYKGAHFATFPTALIEPCILAGAPSGGVVLDPFFGSGTTGQVAQALGRKFIGCELNPAYKSLQDERLQQPSFEFKEAA